MLVNAMSCKNSFPSFVVSISLAFEKNVSMIATEWWIVVNAILIVSPISHIQSTRNLLYFV